MLFYTGRLNLINYGLIVSTYIYHNFYNLGNRPEFTLPVFEGIDVKTEKFYGNYPVCSVLLHGGSVMRKDIKKGHQETFSVIPRFTLPDPLHQLFGLLRC